MKLKEYVTKIKTGLWDSVRSHRRKKKDDLSEKLQNAHRN